MLINPWPYTYIRKLADEATYLAKRNGLRPALDQEIVRNYRRTGRLHLPFLGDYIPDDWEEDVTGLQVFIDRTDSATPGRPNILTLPEFFRQVEPLAQGDKRYGFGVVEMGQIVALVARYIRKETT